MVCGLCETDGWDVRGGAIFKEDAPSPDHERWKANACHMFPGKMTYLFHFVITIDFWVLVAQDLPSSVHLLPRIP